MVILVPEHYETPYKTMGQYDNNMDTAIALNSHGGLVKA